MNHKDTKKKKHKKQWYVATLIIRCRVANEPAPYTCDEQIRLIRARSPEKAYEKAIKLGKEQEVNYLNENGEDVYWEFLGLEELHELEEPIRDSLEIRSRLSEQIDPALKVVPKERLWVFQSNKKSPSADISRALC